MIIQGDTVVVENEDLRLYDGKEVIVTILDTVTKQKGSIDWDSFVMPSNRHFYLTNGTYQNCFPRAGGYTVKYIEGLRAEQTPEGK